MVICAVLIELKHSYLPILQAIGDAHPSSVLLGEGQHGEPAPEQEARGLLHREGARLGSDANDLDARALGGRRCRSLDGNPVLAQGPAALLEALHLLLAALQRALLLLQHGLQRGPRVRVLRLPRQIETVSEYPELRQMTVALLGHGQLRADQV